VSDWPPLCCTRCGSGLYIQMTTEGPPFMTYEVVDYISCEDCGAEWDENGTPREVTWLKDLEEEEDNETQD